jgi:hypothetical protein
MGFIKFWKKEVMLPHPSGESNHKPVSQESLQVGSQSRVPEAGSWGWGQFGNPQERECSLLEAAAKQHGEDLDSEH